MLAGRHRALAEIDLEAIRHNVRRLMRDLPPGAVHCAVVKANGYGHGAVPAARAALEAGATWLGVAAVAEAEELRAAGLTAPILIFGPMTGLELEAAVAAGADVVVWSAPFLAAALRLGARVHVKFNSGMGRLGVDEQETRALCAGAAEDGLLVGLMSHFATADEADTTFFEYQLGRFAALAGELAALYPGLLCHTANSAATLRGPRAHFGMIRTGIAMYGLAPSNDDPFKDDLRPAMKLSSYVAGVRVAAPGDSVGYGRRFIADAPTRIGIVPIGYADGVSRLLTNRGDVLVAGRRCRITGTISMDQLTVRLPDDWGRPGDEVVFFGAAGDGVEGRAGESWTGGTSARRDAPDAPRILCEEVAQLLQTINYEVVCDVAPRVVRRYRGVGPAA
ncbi:MAG: alanine racemase [Actinobacteria bacterium]|nr:alanine racemase [Actinomycetota bacterium]